MLKSVLSQAVWILLVSGILISCKNYSDEHNMERKIDSLLGKMTLEEKIGQLIQENAAAGHDENIKNGRVGSILNVVDPEDIRRLQELAVDSSRLGIPLIFARDVIHGFKTIFPIPLGMAATFNPAMVQKSADIAAAEAASVGIRWTFSPMIDVSRDPRWGRVAESFGEDPYLHAQMGVAMVKGYQGTNLSDKGSIAACAKHFAAYGAAEGGRDYNTVSLPENELRDVYLPPFKACVDADIATFMTAFNEINGIPASGNQLILDKILNKEWGFEGVVVSDWESVIQMQTHGYTANMKESAGKAFSAGLHMEMSSKAYANYLAELIREGKIQETKLDDAVRRILRLKFRLGLFKHPYNEPDDFPPLLNENYREIATQIASQSVVMLKNKDHILPISKEANTLAVIGPLADSPHDQLGTWVFDGEKKDAVTPLTGLREYYGTDKIVYAPGLKISRTKTKEGFPAALAAAKQSDMILLFIGEESILSGESHCRADIGLPGAQEELIEALAQTGKPMVAVVMAGRPLTFEQVFDHLDAVLYAWHPGTMAGPAITRLLSGEEIPSGKLPITFPRHVGQVPIYLSQKNTGKPATDETWERMDEIPPEAPQLSIGNTSHYLDYGFEPWFPFGYGLSYTSFEYSNIQINDTLINMGDTLKISADLKNTGKFRGTEVVQFYTRDLVGSRTRPVRELKGFQRVALNPNEVKKVEFTLHTGDLAFYDQDMERVTEPGAFKAWIGGDSGADLELQFRIK